MKFLWKPKNGEKSFFAKKNLDSALDYLKKLLDCQEVSYSTSKDSIYSIWEKNCWRRPWIYKGTLIEIKEK